MKTFAICYQYISFILFYNVTCFTYNLWELKMRSGVESAQFAQKLSWVPFKTLDRLHSILGPKQSTVFVDLFLNPEANSCI